MVFRALANLETLPESTAPRSDGDNLEGIPNKRLLSTGIEFLETPFRKEFVHSLPFESISSINGRDFLAKVERYIIDPQERIQLHNAVTCVYKLHRDQKRDNGSCYVENHLLPCTLEALLFLSLEDESRLPPRAKFITALSGLFHDTPEDSKFTKIYTPEQFQDLLIDVVMVDKEVQEQVSFVVSHLTKEPKNSELFRGIDATKLKSVRDTEALARFAACVLSPSALAPVLLNLKGADRCNNLAGSLFNLREYRLDNNLEQWERAKQKSTRCIHSTNHLLLFYSEKAAPARRMRELIALIKHECSLPPAPCFAPVVSKNSF